jgi:subtilisin family serine protease
VNTLLVIVSCVIVLKLVSLLANHIAKISWRQMYLRHFNSFGRRRLIPLLEGILLNVHRVKRIDQDRIERLAARTLLLLLLAAPALHFLVTTRDDSMLVSSIDTVYSVPPVTDLSSYDDYPDESQPSRDLTSSDTLNHVYILQNKMWWINKIEALQGLQIATTGEPIIVAVLDTGIARADEHLAGKIVDEANFADSPTSGDLYGHGTHMANEIAAVAPKCKLLNVKVADDMGQCEPSAVASGIIWAVDRGAKVVNLSLTMKPLPDLEEAVDYAWRNGALIVAAAGNLGGSKPVYPAYYANCLAVEALDEKGSLSTLSNYGDWVNVAAPGFDISSESLQNEDDYKSCTSLAAAHISGVAALAFSVAADTNGDGLANDEVRQTIEDNFLLSSITKM